MGDARYLLRRGDSNPLSPQQKDAIEQSGTGAVMAEVAVAQGQMPESPLPE